MPSAGPEPGPDIAGSEQPVRPEWNWEREYYCRDVAIGTRDLGHDCQVVTVSGNRIAYTQKKGSGQTPTFDAGLRELSLGPWGKVQAERSGEIFPLQIGKTESWEYAGGTGQPRDDGHGHAVHHRVAAMRMSEVVRR